MFSSNKYIRTFFSLDNFYCLKMGRELLSWATQLHRQEFLNASFYIIILGLESSNCVLIITYLKLKTILINNNSSKRKLGIVARKSFTSRFQQKRKNRGHCNTARYCIGGRRSSLHETTSQRQRKRRRIFFGLTAFVKCNSSA